MLLGAGALVSAGLSMVGRLRFWSGISLSFGLDGDYW